MLKNLTFTSCYRVHENALELLSNLTALQKLNLDHLTNGKLFAISKSTTIKELSLEQCQCVSNEGLTALSSFKSLQQLTFSGGQSLEGSGLAVLSNLTSLRELNLVWCPIPDQVPLALAGLTHLKQLTLDGCSEMTDNGLSELGRLSALQALFLGNNENITDEGLVYLNHLPELQDIRLSNVTKITGSFLNKGFHRLGLLELFQCDKIFTFSQLTVLSRFSTLHTLDLNESKIINDQCLDALITCRALRKIYLSGCPNITEGGVAVLKDRFAASQHVSNNSNWELEVYL